MRVLLLAAGSALDRTTRLSEKLADAADVGLSDQSDGLTFGRNWRSYSADAGAISPSRTVVFFPSKASIQRFRPEAGHARLRLLRVDRGEPFDPVLDVGDAPGQG
jgi:hypothetical protein